MKIITQRDRVLGIRQRWKAQYKHEWIRPHSRSIKVYRKLCALNYKTCVAADVNKIIGNACWTTLECSECEAKTDWVIALEESDSLIQLCQACVKKLHSLLPTDADSLGEVIQTCSGSSAEYPSP